MANINKVFPDLAYVDNLNVQLPQGMSFQVHDHAGQLVMNSKAVENILKHQDTLDPVDVSAIEALPEIEIDEQVDIDEARLTAIEDRLNLIEDRLSDLETP